MHRGQFAKRIGWLAIAAAMLGAGPVHAEDDPRQK